MDDLTVSEGNLTVLGHGFCLNIRFGFGDDCFRRLFWDRKQYWLLAGESAIPFIVLFEKFCGCSFVGGEAYTYERTSRRS